MDIAIKRNQAIAEVAVSGRLDTMSSGQFDQAVNALLDDEATKFLLDFGGLEYISSSGLRSILILGKNLRTLDGTLVLCGLNELVTEVFVVSGFDKLFTICPGRDEGLASLS